ncbi:hypothetical protein NQ317_006952 [Molorchus minor]|uniref:Transposase Helix-turn-helix domain-containing protein n=1 Tax=Molorchus minor TaxID=1323400 RepID=A0ABQ9J219_9CUCU|nr:hypothetical protein NQ317_006952 [Molorchus minor]
MFQEVAQKFDIAVSTAHKSVKKVMDFLVHVTLQYLQFPSSAQEKQTMHDIPCITLQGWENVNEADLETQKIGQDGIWKRKYTI